MSCGGTRESSLGVQCSESQHMRVEAGWICSHASKHENCTGTSCCLVLITWHLCFVYKRLYRDDYKNTRCARMQAAMDSAHSMKRMGSMPRTSSAKSLSTAEQPAPHHTPGGGPQAPSQQAGRAHQSAAGQYRSSQPHRPDQTAGPEGSVQQPLLTRQGSKGLSTASGVRTNGHAR